MEEEKQLTKNIEETLDSKDYDVEKLVELIVRDYGKTLKKLSET